MGREILDKQPPQADERISYGEHPLHFGELRVPKSGRRHPLAILIHGGFWRAAFDLKHMGHIGADLAAHGVATWSIEYRRIGDSGGAWPATGDDVRRAVAYAREFAAGSPVVTLGFSAGGQLSLWVAGEKLLPLKGAVSLAGVVDLRRAAQLKLSGNVVADFLGNLDRIPEASPLDRLPLGVTTRLFHGANDDVVPVEISRRYTTAARQAGDDATLVEFPGAGHFELIDPQSLQWPTIRGEILRLLL